MKTKKFKLKAQARKRLITGGILAACILVASIGVYFGVTVYSQIKDFNINNLTTTTRSSQISEDGKTYYTYGTAQGKYTYYDDIPEIFVDAVVAAEDSRFFIHDGFDMPRIVKALLQNVRARTTVAGGSTITQQLIKKTYYPNEEKTLQRKLGEVILSIQATQQTTKQKIFELYVNKIYFGRTQTSVGIYAASKYYFAKTPDKLTLPEAALLAGTVNSPSAYDPYNRLDLAQKRRDMILNLMYQHGYITNEQCEETKKIPVANILNYDPIKQSKKYASYVDRVTREVKQLTGYDPNKTNMTIYTYLDTEIQQYLDDISNGTEYTFPDQYMQTGGVVQETTTGRVLGILSARDYKVGNYSYAFTDKHQPGSSIKPILDYGPAFEYLYWNTGKLADDSKYSSGNWTPRNWDRQYHGKVTLYEALGRSWNLAAINTLNTVWKTTGKQKLITWLENFGFDMDSENFSLSYAIGGWSKGTTPLQMAASYAAISNGGTYIQPHTIKKIVINTTGETIEIDEQLRSKSVQAMSDYTAFMLREIMTSYVKTYSDYSDFDIGMKIGAKTGTTNHDGSISGIASGRSKDNWLCAFSEDYSWAFWNGYTEADQKKYHKYLSGTNRSKQIAAKIAKLLKSRETKNSYEQPDSVVKARATVDGRRVTAWFEKNHLPSGATTTDDDDDTTTLSTLSSFTASINNLNQIEVTFTAYTPSSSITSGEVVYRVEVYKGSSRVYRTSLTSESGTLSFTPEEGTTYSVRGCYAYANGSGTSNTISQSITTSSTSSEDASYSVRANGSTLTSGSSTTSTSVTISTEGSSTSTLSITLNGQTKTVTAGNSATFTNLSPGSYRVRVTETKSDGTSQSLTSTRFRVVESTDTNDD